MSDKPFALVKIDDLAANIRSTMARAGDVFPPSLRRQTGSVVASFLRTKLAGIPFIHPGMAKMAKWGQCSERQARHNFGLLKRWGVVEVVEFPKGGRRASRFIVHLSAIEELLVEMGANPSAALCEKLFSAENPEVNPEVILDKNPAVLPATTSAGIHTTGEPPSTDVANKPLRIVGGRDA